MTAAAKWLRRFELVLVVAGIGLVGGALAATVVRWNYQAREERAFDRAASRFETADERGMDRGSWFAGDSANAPPANPLAFARIEIPRVGVKAIVREGSDTATLALAVGHLEGTASPGERGNVVLAGHRDTFFRGLRDIRINDRVRIDVPPNSYEYRVIAFGVVDPDDTRVLDETEGHELTLVTCYPFGFIGHAPQRFIVRAAGIE